MGGCLMENPYWLADFECHGCRGHANGPYCPGWQGDAYDCVYLAEDDSETLDNHLSGSLAPMKDRSYE